ncbi:MAG: hypothetical protein Q8K60_03635 [Parachlamydiaceae bacterium]|nr:hypothetical protein [Parachlamydiaceae bacterium]
MSNISSVRPKSNNDDSKNKTENDRPPPPKNDDFKKLYKKDGQPSKEELEELPAEMQETEEKPLSLFELAKGKPKTKSPLVKEGQQEPSPFGQTSEKSKLKEKSAFSESENLDEGSLSSEETVPKEGKVLSDRPVQKEDIQNSQKNVPLPKEKPTNETSLTSEKKEESSVKNKKTDSSSTLTEGKADASQVSGAFQPVQGVGLGIDRSQATPQPSASSTIAEIVNKLVESIQVMKKEDLSETIVTLKNPPVLAGATMTLIANDHAKTEFNVAFNGLNPEQKLFLDQKLSEHSLSDSLSKKGIILHMVTTSTEPHQVLTVDTGQTANREREQREEQRQREQENRQDEEES